MLIKLTNAQTKNVTVLPHNAILHVEKVAGSLLETQIITGLSVGGKQLILTVLETPEEVMNLANAAALEEIQARRSAGLH